MMKINCLTGQAFGLRLLVNVETYDKVDGIVSDSGLQVSHRDISAKQNMCIPFVLRRPNVLYKCFLCLLG